MTGLTLICVNLQIRGQYILESLRPKVRTSRLKFERLPTIVIFLLTDGPLKE